ncbi:hypothetical protein D3C74_363040 [compost metagenome]
MSRSLTRIALNFFDAENSQTAGNVWEPQKCPPDRTTVMPSNVVGRGPNPSIG